jgi:16S rRNA processing protein RimM
MRAAAVLPGAPVTPDPGAVAVGQVVGAHALRGWLRVKPHHLPVPSLVPGRRVLLQREDAWREVIVTHAGVHGRGLVLLGLDEVTDRTAAEALRGATVRVRRADIPTLGEGEYYHHEVIGFAVETLDGASVGVIAGVMSNGLHDVWEVRAGDREHLIPVVADVVHTIDRAARRVRIVPLPGLLD